MGVFGNGWGWPRPTNFNHPQPSPFTSHLPPTRVPPCFADHFLFRTVGAYGMLTAMFTSTLFGEFGNDLKFVVFRMFPFIVGIHYLFKFLRRGLEGTRLAAASRWHRRIVTNILSFISGTSLPDPNLVLPREHEIYWKSQLNWSVPRRAVSFCDIIKATLWGAGPVRRAHHFCAATPSSAHIVVFSLTRLLTALAPPSSRY